MSNTRVPYLPRGVRRHHDAVRGAEVLLGPERALMLDDIGHAILSEVDGVRSIHDLSADLAARFDAPLEAIASDVAEFLSNLADKRLIEFNDA
ncbi:MAG: pyrroloquinoline quinone biosynthesis peptide chaperone PqqD [Sedimentitalea sp.]